MSTIITARDDAINIDPHISNVSLLLHGNGANGSTTIVDSSPSPKAVTAVGNAQISTAQSRFGGASIAFDGTGDWLNTIASVSPQSGDYTVEVFIRPTFTTGRDRVIYDCRSTSDPQSNGFAFFINSIGYLQVYENAILRSASTATVTANTWQHVALVSSGGTVTYYIGGTAAGSFAATTTASLNTRIGARQDGDAAFTGFIDEFRLTPGVARYTANFTPPTAPFPDF